MPNRPSGISYETAQSYDGTPFVFMALYCPQWSPAWNPWYLCSHCNLEYGRRKFAAKEMNHFLDAEHRKKKLVCTVCKDLEQRPA